MSNPASELLRALNSQINHNPPPSTLPAIIESPLSPPVQT